MSTISKAQELLWLVAAMLHGVSIDVAGSIGQYHLKAERYINIFVYHTTGFPLWRGILVS